MATFTFDHVSRNLIIGNSALYLAGDDLVTRDLVVSKSDLGGEITARAYALDSKNLVLSGGPHTGRFSQQTLLHNSRLLVEQRSTLNSIVAGSVLFPEIVPSQIQFKPAKYVITEHYVQTGELELQLWTDSNTGATLELDYFSISDTTGETVMSLWDSVCGTHKFLRIPQTVLAGVKSELAEYMVKGGEKSKWFFADPPKWNGRLRGYGDLKITLVSKITTLMIGEFYT
jgi:hypothetical protein